MKKNEELNFEIGWTKGIFHLPELAHWKEIVLTGEIGRWKSKNMGAGVTQVVLFS